MSAESSHLLPQYEAARTIKVPTAWPELERLAEGAVPEWEGLEFSKSRWQEVRVLHLNRELRRSAPNLRELGKTIHQMDTTTLEENYFYSVRLASCNLREILEDTDRRQAIVRHGALIVADALKQRSSLVARSVAIYDSFQEPIAEAFEALPQSVKLTTEVLLGARGHAANKKLPGRNWGWRTDLRLANELDRSKYEPRTYRAKHIVKQTTAGASLVCSRALNQDARFHETGTPSEEMRLRLRHPSLQTAARRVTALHAHTANYSQQLVSLEGKGFGFVPQTELTVPLRYRLLSIPHRTKILVCPAARVTDTVEVVAGMVVEMIDQACVQLGEPEIPGKPGFDDLYS